MPAANVKNEGREFWTEERVDRLKKLWADKSISVQKISEAIGAVSRMAVLGKAKRMGLPSRGEKRGGKYWGRRWDDDMIAVLKKWWPENVTADYIAEKVGNGVTKKSVHNKAQRLGLPNRGDIRPRESIARDRKRPEQRKRSARQFVPKPTLAPELLNGEPEHEVPEPLYLQIGDLTSESCRFPIGEVGRPGFGFCGAKAEEGFPYCPYHNAKAADRVATLRSKRRAAKGGGSVQKQAHDFARWRSGK